ncbi:MAG: hypothetical protein JXR70_19670, partial [Spirochaetales bacterium]|nr:hypothetical protein [Spirochaetales bacterium]
LLPRPITYTGKLVAGQAINFDSGITNQGNLASGVFNIKWFFNGQNQGFYGSHSSVAANTTVMNGNSAAIWTPPAAGTYTIEFVVDVDGHVAESNENNNRTSITIRVN